MMKVVLASMASELEKSGVELLDGVLLESLRLVQFRLRLLPDSLGVGEFLLRQLYLPLRLLSCLLRVALLRHRHPQLLSSFFLHHPHCLVHIVAIGRSSTTHHALPWGAFVIVV